MQLLLLVLTHVVLIDIVRGASGGGVHVVQEVLLQLS